MPDRLAELRRQRALVQEHLDWLDGEISAATGAPRPAPTSPATQSVPPNPPEEDEITAGASAFAEQSPPAADPPEVAAAAEAILDEYRVAPDTLKTDVRKGCLLYFFGAFALLILGVAALYLALRRD